MPTMKVSEWVYGLVTRRVLDKVQAKGDLHATTYAQELDELLKESGMEV
ncbi:TPA_asm: hypothetical protein vir520_00022 [Caudoviricetes sp. vir520]|nr:TPA_asm: hypothetical protein vir520_00022 [Caudoviricetes sp. vir520]